MPREIVQLIRETKWLQRIGVEVPEAAKMVLLQEGTPFRATYLIITEVGVYNTSWICDCTIGVRGVLGLRLVQA